MLTYDGKADTSKPKFKPLDAITKFLNYSGIKINNPKTPIYYSWAKDQPQWYVDIETNQYYPESQHITVDYEHNKRTWTIGFIFENGEKTFGMIDDITGRVDLMQAD